MQHFPSFRVIVPIAKRPIQFVSIHSHSLFECIWIANVSYYLRRCISNEETAIFVFISKVKHKPMVKSVPRAVYIFHINIVVLNKYVKKKNLICFFIFPYSVYVCAPMCMHLNEVTQFWKMDRKMMCSGIMYTSFSGQNISPIYLRIE